MVSCAERLAIAVALSWGFETGVDGECFRGGLQEVLMSRVDDVAQLLKSYEVEGEGLERCCAIALPGETFSATTEGYEWRSG